MTRSVVITTPIPTLEEVAKRLGMSKRRQNILLRLANGEDASGKPKRHPAAAPMARKVAAKHKSVGIGSSC